MLIRRREPSSRGARPPSEGTRVRHGHTSPTESHSRRTAGSPTSPFGCSSGGRPASPGSRFRRTHARMARGASSPCTGEGGPLHGHLLAALQFEEDAAGDGQKAGSERIACGYMHALPRIELLARTPLAGDGCAMRHHGPCPVSAPPRVLRRPRPSPRSKPPKAPRGEAELAAASQRFAGLLPRSRHPLRTMSHGSALASGGYNLDRLSRHETVF